VAKIRNVSGEPRIVPWLGGRTVDDDEVVEIPDGHWDNYVCQSAVWEPVEEPAVPAKASAKTVKES
jgi:hypothetical protein